MAPTKTLDLGLTGQFSKVIKSVYKISVVTGFLEAKGLIYKRSFIFKTVLSSFEKLS